MDVKTFMSVEAHAMLLPEIGMHGSQSVNKAHSSGTAACRKTYKCQKVFSHEAFAISIPRAKHARGQACVHVWEPVWGQAWGQATAQPDTPIIHLISGQVQYLPKFMCQGSHTLHLCPHNVQMAQSFTPTPFFRRT